MGTFVNTSDFSGVKNISQNSFTKKDLDLYITEFEVEYLQNLLGCELYDLFIADLDPDNLPQSQRFIDIFYPFCIDEANSFFCHYQLKSKGIVEMLKCFIYWEFVSNQKYVDTITGIIVENNENSRETKYGETQIYKIYNKAITSYRAIQKYIYDNSTSYPEFNGIFKDKNTWF